MPVKPCKELFYTHRIDHFVFAGPKPVFTALYCRMIFTKEIRSNPSYKFILILLVRQQPYETLSYRMVPHRKQEAIHCLDLTWFCWFNTSLSNTVLSNDFYTKTGNNAYHSPFVLAFTFWRTNNYRRDVRKTNKYLGNLQKVDLKLIEHIEVTKITN